MSNDDAKTLEMLRRSAEFATRYSQLNPKPLYDAITLIERQAAEIARKDAEIERLTPALLDSDMRLLEGVAELRNLMNQGDENHRRIAICLCALRSRLYKANDAVGAIVAQDAISLLHRLVRELIADKTKLLRGAPLEPE